MTDDKELTALVKRFGDIPFSRFKHEPLLDVVFADPGRHGFYYRERKPDSVAAYVRVDHLTALTEQLDAARQDADEAEAYAWELEQQLGKAKWILTDAAVQLEEGKVKTRRNRAGLIWQFLEETRDK